MVKLTAVCSKVIGQPVSFPRPKIITFIDSGV